MMSHAAAGTSDMMKLRASTRKMVKEEIKEKLDRSASNERRRCPSGRSGGARDAPTAHFQQKYIIVSSMYHNQ